MMIAHEQKIWPVCRKLSLKVQVNKSASKIHDMTGIIPNPQQTKSFSLLIIVRSNLSQPVRRVMNRRTQFWKRRPQIWLINSPWNSQQQSK